MRSPRVLRVVCGLHAYFGDVVLLLFIAVPSPDYDSSPELCPQDAPMKCSATYTVTQADVDSGKRSNTVTVTDGATSDDDETTVLVHGSAEVTLGEACV